MSTSLSELEAYRQMAAIREFERICLQLSADGAVQGSIHLCLGQEAIPVGANAALTSNDLVTSTYRGHGWALSRGVGPRALLAEICHKEDGVNGGRGGSAYFTAPDRGFMGENSIVGAGIPISAGLAMVAADKGGYAVLTTIGDGAMNQGATYEGLVFATVRQLPLIVICENNAWAEMTPAASMTRAPLSDRAAAIGMAVIRADGCDPWAVAAAVAEARVRAVEGGGPTFIECDTVRLSGHYNRDIEHYRPAADKRDAEEREPLKALRHRRPDLASDFDAIDAQAKAELEDLAAEVVTLPDPDPVTALDHVVATTVPSPYSPPTGESTNLTYQMALNTALRREIEDRPEVRVYGEDVGFAGGIFGVTRRLAKDFGPERVFDTPISESAILGSAVGASIAGYRPVVEIMWADFLLVALDQLINQAANVRYISRGQLTAPMVVRTQQGVTPGSCAQHSQNLEALLTHIPGLKVGLPATPNDAYLMLRAAVADQDPCVIIEARSLYQTEGPVWLDATENVFGARLARPGTDVGIITWGTGLAPALKASQKLEQSGVSAGVLDLRWLNPLDVDAMDQFVRTVGGRVVVAQEANGFGGFGAEVASQIHLRNHDLLAGPVTRVAMPETRVPAAPALQDAIVPDSDDIVAACLRSLKRVEGAEP